MANAVGVPCKTLYSFGALMPQLQWVPPLPALLLPRTALGRWVALSPESHRIPYIHPPGGVPIENDYLKQGYYNPGPPPLPLVGVNCDAFHTSELPMGSKVKLLQKTYFCLVSSPV